MAIITLRSGETNLINPHTKPRESHASQIESVAFIHDTSGHEGLDANSTPNSDSSSFTTPPSQTSLSPRKSFSAKYFETKQMHQQQMSRQESSESDSISTSSSSKLSHNDTDTKPSFEEKSFQSEENCEEKPLLCEEENLIIGDPKFAESTLAESIHEKEQKDTLQRNGLEEDNFGEMKEKASSPLVMMQNLDNNEEVSISFIKHIMMLELI